MPYSASSTYAPSYVVLMRKLSHRRDAATSASAAGIAGTTDAQFVCFARSQVHARPFRRAGQLADRGDSAIGEPTARTSPSHANRDAQRTAAPHWEGAPLGSASRLDGHVAAASECAAPRLAAPHYSPPHAKSSARFRHLSFSPSISAPWDPSLQTYWGDEADVHSL